MCMKHLILYCSARSFAWLKCRVGTAIWSRYSCCRWMGMEWISSIDTGCQPKTFASFAELMWKREIIDVCLLTQMRAVVTLCWHCRGTWANLDIGSGLNTVAWSATWDYLLCILAAWGCESQFHASGFGIHLAWRRPQQSLEATVTEDKQNTLLSFIVKKTI